MGCSAPGAHAPGASVVLPICEIRPTCHQRLKPWRLNIARTLWRERALDKNQRIVNVARSDERRKCRLQSAQP